MNGWFDSHCHVQEEYLPEDPVEGTDLEPVLARAAEAGITRMVCIGTGLTTSVQAVAVARATAAWARWAPHEALEATWRLIGAANAELESAEPWKMEPGPAVDAVLGDALEVLRIVAVLLAPAMPSTAVEVWRRIGVAGDPSTARVPDDARWGNYAGGAAALKGHPLFPRRKA